MLSTNPYRCHHRGRQRSRDPDRHSDGDFGRRFGVEKHEHVVDGAVPVPSPDKQRQRSDAKHPVTRSTRRPGIRSSGHIISPTLKDQIIIRRVNAQSRLIIRSSGVSMGPSYPEDGAPVLDRPEGPPLGRLALKWRLGQLTGPDPRPLQPAPA
jgi:hypothetical protein